MPIGISNLYKNTCGSRNSSKKAKYGNRRTERDGLKFDSKREANRYSELKLLQRAGEITSLELQKKFELVPTQLLPSGKKIKPITYIADFVYIVSGTGEQVVEDVKGFKTKEYTLKKKLMLYFHNIDIREV